jgi:hypothetical protein
MRGWKVSPTDIVHLTSLGPEVASLTNSSIIRVPTPGGIIGLRGLPESLEVNEEASGKTHITVHG